MELKNLKSRLAVAIRGHKLFKDKCDELVKQYGVLVKQNYKLASEVEAKLLQLQNDFVVAKCHMSVSELLQTFVVQSKECEIDFESQMVLGIEVANAHAKKIENKNLPFAFALSGIGLDDCAKKICNLLPKIVKLASLSHTCNRLGEEIVRAKRRVNALEFLTIPNLQDTIKYVSFKIEEQDLASKVRLLKAKQSINSFHKE